MNYIIVDKKKRCEGAESFCTKVKKLRLTKITK